MSGSTFTLEPKNIDDMLAALKKAAGSIGFNLKGDKKSGRAAKTDVPPTIEYEVKGQTVTITIDTGGMNLDNFERAIKDSIRPYR